MVNNDSFCLGRPGTVLFSIFPSPLSKVRLDIFDRAVLVLKNTVTIYINTHRKEFVSQKCLLFLPKGFGVQERKKYRTHQICEFTGAGPGSTASLRLLPC